MVQDALSSLGLEFGSEVVDRVMLLCKIDGSGSVDYSAFADDVSRSLRSTDATTKAVVPHATDDALAGKGLEFQKALADSLGVHTSASIPADLLALPQPDRVRKLATHINSLFNQYDNGNMTADVLKENLTGLGLEISGEVDRLLRQESTTFSQFFKALTLERTTRPHTGSERAAGGSANSSASSDLMFSPEARAGGRSHGRARVKAPGAGSRGGDVITWRNDDYAIRRGRAHVEEGGRGATTERFGHYLPGGSERLNVDTGARKLIYGGVPDDDGAGTRAFESEFRSGGKRGHQLPQESGAKEALWGYGHDDADRFETYGTAMLKGGLGLRRSGGARSGGDRGLLREQIYSCVRQLDSGSMTAHDFRVRLTQLGVPVPAEVDRLLANAGAAGRAQFTQFVRAFEPYFADREAATASDDVPVETAPDRSPRRSPLRSKKSAPAQGFMDEPTVLARAKEASEGAASRHGGHGNILTWQDTPDITPAEYRAMIRDGVRPSIKKKVKGLDQRMYSTGGTEHILHWEKGETDIELVNKSRKKGSELRHRDAGNILAWAGGDFRDDHGARVTAEEPGAMHTSSIFHSDMASRRGTKRPTTGLAAAERAAAVPFGTEADVGVEVSEEEKARLARKAEHASRTLQGGSWMSYVDEDTVERPTGPSSYKAPKAPWEF